MGYASQKVKTIICLLVVVCVVTSPRTLFSKVVNFASTANDSDLKGLVQMTLTRTCWDVGQCLSRRRACLSQVRIIRTYPFLSYLSAIIERHERLSASEIGSDMPVSRRGTCLSQVRLIRVLTYPYLSLLILNHPLLSVLLILNLP